MNTEKTYKVNVTRRSYKIKTDTDGSKFFIDYEGRKRPAPKLETAHPFPWPDEVLEVPQEEFTLSDLLLGLGKK